MSAIKGIKLSFDNDACTAEVPSPTCAFEQFREKYGLYCYIKDCEYCEVYEDEGAYRVICLADKGMSSVFEIKACPMKKWIAPGFKLRKNAEQDLLVGHGNDGPGSEEFINDPDFRDGGN